MEAIAAVASFIAIGDALGKLPKIVGFVRSLPEIQNEAAALANELETLRATHAQIENVAESLTSLGDELDHEILQSIDTSLLQRATNELKGILENLDDFYKACHTPEGDCKDKKSPIKVKRLKWIWKKHKLQEIYQKITRVRSDLQLALNTLMMLLQRSQTHIVLEIKQISCTSASNIDRELKGLRSLLEYQDRETKDEDGGRDVDAVTAVLQASMTSAPTESEELYSSNSSEFSGAEDNDFIDEKDVDFKNNEQFIRLQATMMGICPRNCRCRCHINPPTRAEPISNWLRPVLGSLLVNYNVTPVWRRITCTEPSCMRSESSLRVNYTFPSWLCARTLSINASLSSMTSVGATLHFTLGRVFPLSSDYCITHAMMSVSQFLDHGKMLHPRDIHAGGEFFIETVIVKNNFELLAYLMNLWMPVLRHIEIDRRIVIRAVLALNEIQKRPFQHHSKTEIASLRQLISFEPDVDIHNDPLPRRILLMQDKTLLIKSLEDLPESINALDRENQSPLHVVATQDDAVALQILIHKGAEIDQPDAFDRTPLMVAAAAGSHNCVRLLVDAGSKLTACSWIGDCPLHYAARSSHLQSFDIMKLLLQRDRALARLRNKQGFTPLHSLATSANNQDRPTLARKVRLLLDAGTDIDVRDAYGQSPLGHAITANKVNLCQILVDAGATLRCCVGFSRPNHNILHVAALSCTARTLRWLQGHKLLGIDVKAVNKYGNTVWDLFIYVLGADESELEKRGRREPKVEEVMAFVSLYLDVRNLNLRSEIEALKAVAAALGDRQVDTACNELDSLMRRTQEFNSSTEADVYTYRVMGYQVKEKMWEAAMEAVEEKIEVLRERMRSSPWKRRSRFDGPLKLAWEEWYDEYPSMLWEGVNEIPSDVDDDADSWYTIDSDEGD